MTHLRSHTSWANLDVFSFGVSSLLLSLATQASSSDLNGSIDQVWVLQLYALLDTDNVTVFTRYANEVYRENFEGNCETLNLVQNLETLYERRVGRPAYFGPYKVFSLTPTNAKVQITILSSSHDRLQQND